MTSEKQIEANRLNAQKSSGPRSPEGKARSAQNALKFGIHAKSEIIRGEQLEDLEALSADYFETYSPETSAERTQVKIMTRCEWQLDRLAAADAHVWESQMGLAVKLHPACPLGDIFHERSSTFMRICRKVETLERSFRQATLELERLQAARRAAEAIPAPLEAPLPDPHPEPAAPPQPVESKPPSTEIGFVPSNSPKNSPAARQVDVPASGTPTTLARTAEIGFGPRLRR